MLPTTANGAPASSVAEPQLMDRTLAPRGVVQTNLKQLLVIGGVLVIVLAGFVSSFRKKPGLIAPAKQASAAPLSQPDNTANNVAALHSTLGEERQLEPEDAQVAQAVVPASPSSPAIAYGPNGLPASTSCVPGQPCSGASAGYVTATQSSGGQPQLTPAEQEAQLLAAKERERQYASRFESNLVYSQSAALERTEQGSEAQAHAGVPTNLSPARALGEHPEPSAAGKRTAEVNVDAAVGQPYVLYEGTTLDTVLMNRLDGDAAGPVKVLVSNPVYSHDHQHVVIPEGTVALGEARKIGSAGFGQQRRMAVVFHRLLMPDGYSVDLDQFHGLDQIGQEGVKDKVNNHYLEIFGTSVALGVISGAAQITEGGVGYSATGSQAFVNGAATGVSQQATIVLDRFIQIPPTITIREGHRVKVYFTQDMLLPAYENHRIPQTF